MRRWTSHAPPTILKGLQGRTNPHRFCLIDDQDLVNVLNVASDAQREERYEDADVILRDVISNSSSLDTLPVDLLCPLSMRTLIALYGAGLCSLADIMLCELERLRCLLGVGNHSRMLLGKRMQSIGINILESDYRWATPRKKPATRTARVDRLIPMPVFVFGVPCGMRSTEAIRDFLGRTR